MIKTDERNDPGPSAFLPSARFSTTSSTNPSQTPHSSFFDSKLNFKMTIKEGDAFPSSTLYESLDFDESAGCPLNPQPVDTLTSLKGKKVAIFGLPGAYTPTCSAKHVPGYVKHYAELKEKGVDEIWCVAVNDAFVMASWGRTQHAQGKVRMLGDGSAELAKKLGLEMDASARGMGVRCQRFAMLVDDGVVKKVAVEQPGKFEVSSAENVLSWL